MKGTYKRIIISRTDKIGDLVLSIPSIFMIKKMYPNAEIVLLIKSYCYDLVKNIPYVDRILKIDEYKPSKLLERIHYFEADVFIALYVDDFVIELAKASKAKKLIGPISKWKSIFTFRSGVIQKRSLSRKNEAEYNLDLIKKLDKNLFEKNFEINTDIYLSENNKKAAEQFFKDNNIGEKVLVVNPFTGGSAKNITDEQYTKIISLVKSNVKDLDIIIITHISEEKRGLKLLKLIDRERVYLYANGGDLLNIGAVIDRATVYLGASTGPTHIAGSLKKSIVAIYPKKATQSPKRWGVFGNDDVSYIIPDKNSRESYKKKIFTSYSKGTETVIVKELVKKLER